VEKFDLDRANPWMPTAAYREDPAVFSLPGVIKINGRSPGTASFKSVHPDRLRFEVPSGEAGWAGMKKASWRSIFETQPRRSLDGRVSSRMLFNSISQGRKTGSRWKALDLALFQSFLPAELNLKGKNSGISSGMVSGSRFEAEGKQSFRSPGSLAGKPEAFFHKTGAPRPTSHGGDSSRESEFEVLRSRNPERILSSSPFGPLFPLYHPGRPFRLSVQGQLRENGLLSRLYPERLQESRERSSWP